MTTWTVPATILRITDADTITALADLGWHLTLTVKIRIAGINAPELRTPEGRAARDFAAAILPDGAQVTMHSRGLDKYGRTLADITLPDGQDYAKALLTAKHAQPYPAPRAASAGRVSV